MKTRLTAQSVVALLLLTALFTGLIVATGYSSSFYTRRVTVTEVQGSCVTCKDPSGRLWQFYDNVGTYKKWQTLSLRMTMNGTKDDVTDDLILKVNGHRITAAQGYLGKE